MGEVGEFGGWPRAAGTNPDGTPYDEPGDPYARPNRVYGVPPNGSAPNGSVPHGSAPPYGDVGNGAARPHNGNQRPYQDPGVPYRTPAQPRPQPPTNAVPRGGQGGYDPPPVPPWQQPRRTSYGGPPSAPYAEPVMPYAGPADLTRPATPAGPPNAAADFTTHDVATPDLDLSDFDSSDFTAPAPDVDGDPAATGTTSHRVGGARRAGGAQQPRRKGGRRRRLKPIKLSREIPILIVVALGLALLIKTFLVQAFWIPSQSMEDTIMPGDRVLVNKLSPWFGWKPQRGEIVVFNDPGGWLESTGSSHENAIVGGVKDVFSFIGLLPASNEHDLIKRVIGVPGDTVKCCDAQGRITVDNVPLSEKSYIYPHADPSDYPPGGFTVHVPAGDIFVLGDNRGDSADSRYHLRSPNGPFVPIKDVVGHAFVRIWPLSRMGGLGVPATFGQKALRALSDLGPAGSPPALAALLVLPVGAWRQRRARRRARKVSCHPTGWPSSVSRALRDGVRVRCRIGARRRPPGLRYGRTFREGVNGGPGRLGWCGLRRTRKRGTDRAGRRSAVVRDTRVQRGNDGDRGH
jgi:signal peptidase I